MAASSETFPAPAARVDAIGRLCPIPVVWTAERMRALRRGDVLELLADDPLAVLDLRCWSQSWGHEYLGHVDRDGILHVFLRKRGHDGPASRAETPRAAASRTGAFGAGASRAATSRTGASRTGASRAGASRAGASRDSSYAGRAWPESGKQHDGLPVSLARGTQGGPPGGDASQRAALDATVADGLKKRHPARAAGPAAEDAQAGPEPPHEQRAWDFEQPPERVRRSP